MSRRSFSYPRRRFRRRRYYRRPGRRRYTRYSAKRFQNKMYYNLHALAEKKFRNLSSGSIAPDFSGNMAHLSGLTQGDTNETRTGNKIQPIYLSLRFTAEYDTVDAIIRVIILQWRDTTGPTASDVLHTTGDEQIVNSPYLATSSSKYKILFDRNYHVDSVGTPQISRKINLNLKSRKNVIRFSGSGVNDYLHNNLQILYCSNVDGLATPPEMYFYSRVAYSDY